MSVEKQLAYQNMDSAFQNGTFNNADDNTLIQYLISLSNQNIVNSQIQHRDIIRGITINHIIMQRHIDRLNKQNAKTQTWVIVLAVAALISSIVQIFSPVLFPEQPIVIQQQPPIVKLSCPAPEKTQETCNSIKKTP